MPDLKKWQERADGGDSRYAIALSVMALADAINTLGLKNAVVIENISTTIDEKFNDLIRLMEGDRSDEEATIVPDEPESTVRSIFGRWRK